MLVLLVRLLLLLLLQLLVLQLLLLLLLLQLLVQLDPQQCQTTVMSNRYEDNESVGLGLGYGSTITSTTSIVVNTPTSSVDDLMKHYLDQCLTFHKEQQQQSSSSSLQQQQQQQQLLSPDKAPTFISASSEGTYSIPVVTSTSKEEQHPPLDIRVPEDVLAKARAIVRSFSTESPPDQYSPFDYRQQRIRHAQKEQIRLHNAWRKNLQYIADRQQEKLKQQLQQIEQAKAYEQQLYEQQQQHYIQRTTATTATTTIAMNTNNSNKAGIGTKSQKVQNQRQKKDITKQSDTVALYLEGIPANGDNNLIQSIFQSYGTIQKVHFYRNQTTGECKGDCLLVYQLASGQNRDELIDLVCMQVSDRGEVAVICVNA